MNITLEEKKTEALERMEMLNLYPNIVKEFKKDGIVNMSEHGGMLYWLTDEQKGFVEEFEAEYNALASPERQAFRQARCSRIIPLIFFLFKFSQVENGR